MDQTFSLATPYTTHIHLAILSAGNLCISEIFYHGHICYALTNDAHCDDDTFHIQIKLFHRRNLHISKFSAIFLLGNVYRKCLYFVTDNENIRLILSSFDDLAFATVPSDTSGRNAASLKITIPWPIIVDFLECNLRGPRTVVLQKPVAISHFSSPPLPNQKCRGSNV